MGFGAAALLLALTLQPAPCQAQEAELARLRRENIRLRVKVDSLQRIVDRGRGGISSLDEAPDEGDGFFSLLSIWDEFEEEGDGSGFGGDLKALSQVDTLFGIPEDDVVRRYIDMYTVGRGAAMIRVLQRYDRALPDIRKVFERYGIPEEITMLAIVESAVNPRARSHAGAAGMWQLMPDAARERGLRVTAAVDDRYDVARSTVAAAKILSDARKRFGSWGPAVMSYNCGPGRMQKALDQCGGDVTYERLYALLPRETRDYLPALVAAMYVNANRRLLFPQQE